MREHAQAFRRGREHIIFSFALNIPCRIESCNYRKCSQAMCSILGPQKVVRENGGASIQCYHYTSWEPCLLQSELFTCSSAAFASLPHSNFIADQTFSRYNSLLSSELLFPPLTYTDKQVMTIPLKQSTDVNAKTAAARLEQIKAQLNLTPSPMSLQAPQDMKEERAAASFDIQKLAHFWAGGERQYRLLVTGWKQQCCIRQDF